MPVKMPQYDWEAHEALIAKIQVLDKLLLGFQRKRRPDDESGEHILAFLRQHKLVRLDDTASRPHVDVERLSQKMVRDALLFADQCAVRSHKIVAYLQNICMQFTGGAFDEKIDGEILMRQIDLHTIQNHIGIAGIVYGQQDAPYYDRTFHTARESDVELAQFYYQELLQNRRRGGDAEAALTGLSPVFNLAGNQVALAMTTQRYASAAIELSNNVSVLLGATATKSDGALLDVRHKALCSMAEDLLIGAVFALDEAAQLARESYRALECMRPIFRAEPVIRPTRQYPGSHQL